MQCAICGIETGLFEESTDSGWVLCFYEGEEEHGPACPTCAATLLCAAEDGEMEVRDQYIGRIVYQDCTVEENMESLLMVGMVFN
jgi:hypothetical protein